ncbi:hypothetical protein, partial [Mycolicibacterium cosmeticum]|uniref:hypothetical protein n=1 Tax=Mycolicibacterium cosmeticum TaxID=258533 RepID=UPI001F35DEB3
FGGYKQSGIGRENHHMMLDHYQQTKNLLVSYSETAAGFFYGIGRENHHMMLDHYQQTKNLLVSYSETAAGFF